MIPVLFRGVLVAAVAVFGAIAVQLPVNAESVRIQPLQYQTELKKGEKKKGHVDVSNPSNETVTVKLYVNGFSQIDNKGNLTFFDNEQMTKGILLDYDEVRLDPKQSLRLFFIADGTKLPSGDVFAVIFAETKPTQKAGTATAARVGTLVMLVNQTPGPRIAEITDIQIPFLQIGETVEGSVAVKNPAPKGKATGFFPEVSIGVSPWGSTTKQQGPLIFAGNTRTINFTQPSNAFGLYQVNVQANNAAQTRWVFLVTGWWQVIVPVVMGLGIGIVFAVLRYRHKLSQRIRFKHR